MYLAKELELSQKILEKQKSNYQDKEEKLKNVMNDINVCEKLIQKTSYKNYLKKLGIAETVVIISAIFNPLMNMALVPMTITVGVSTIAFTNLINRSYVQKVAKRNLSKEEISHIIKNRQEILEDKLETKENLEEKLGQLKKQMDNRINQMNLLKVKNNLASSTQNIDNKDINIDEIKVETKQKQYIKKMNF